MRIVPALFFLLALASGCRPDAQAERSTADDQATTTAPAEAAPKTYTLPSVQAERPSVDSSAWTIAPNAGPTEQAPIAIDEADGAVTDASFSDAYAYAYLNAATQNNVGAMLDQYADRVTYYDWGVVGHDRIRADKEAYTARWPRRAFTLTNDPQISANGNAASVRLDYTFEVAGENRKRTGTAWTALVYAFDGREWKIVEERGGTR